MKVYVDSREVVLSPGMTVKHALRQAGRLSKSQKPQTVYDEWGNEVGLDGELSEGEKLFLRKPES